MVQPPASVPDYLHKCSVARSSGNRAKLHVSLLPAMPSWFRASPAAALVVQGSPDHNYAVRQQRGAQHRTSCALGSVLARAAIALPQGLSHVPDTVPHADCHPRVISLELHQGCDLLQGGWVQRREKCHRVSGRCLSLLPSWDLVGPQQLARAKSQPP